MVLRGCPQAPTGERDPCSGGPAFWASLQSPIEGRGPRQGRPFQAPHASGDRRRCPRRRGQGTMTSTSPLRQVVAGPDDAQAPPSTAGASTGCIRRRSRPRARRGPEGVLQQVAGGRVLPRPPGRWPAGRGTPARGRGRAPAGLRDGAPAARQRSWTRTSRRGTASSSTASSRLPPRRRCPAPAPPSGRRRGRPAPGRRRLAGTRESEQPSMAAKGCCAAASSSRRGGPLAGVHHAVGGVAPVAIQEARRASSGSRTAGRPGGRRGAPASSLVPAAPSAGPSSPGATAWRRCMA